MTFKVHYCSAMDVDTSSAWKGKFQERVAQQCEFSRDLLERGNLGLSFPMFPSFLCFPKTGKTHAPILRRAYAVI